MTEAAQPLVTVAVPLYKRMRFLPIVLKSVAEQDYPEIELLVSDNGENGPEIREMVRSHYTRPFTFRRNEVTEPVMSTHFNQLVESANGKYFVLLCDDDEIGPRFVSSMVERLEADPDIGLAIPLVELMDECGAPLSEQQAADLPYSRPELKDLPPGVFSGLDFVRYWVSGRYRFKTFVTVMARTEEISAIGGYPQMPTGDDDAVALRLALGHKVAFCTEAVFRNRAYETSAGLDITPWDLAHDIRRWLEFLDSDPVLRRYAAEHPVEWQEVRELMRQKAWRTYRHRWKGMYRRRMEPAEWLRAGFALPFIPEYYRWLSGYLLKRGLSRTKRLVRGRP
jgi:glycosyltransferase involved in cell wall biosynthesis